MRTANNTNNYTVEGLVAKYRNFVKENTPMVTTSCEGKEFEIPQSDIDASSDQQLIVSLYACVAANNTEKEVLSVLSDYADHFYKEALSDDEFSFLCANFAKTIEYEFNHRQDWHYCPNLYGGERYKKLNVVVRERVSVSSGQMVFITEAGYCDLAILFKGCVVKGYTSLLAQRFEDWKIVWALGQIRLYAAGVHSEIVPYIDLDKEINAPVSQVQNLVDLVVCDKFSHRYEQLYDLLKKGGQMFIFADRDDLVDHAKIREFYSRSEQFDEAEAKRASERRQFLSRLIEERAIKSIVSFEDEDIILDFSFVRILLQVEKNDHAKVIVESTNSNRKAEVDPASLDVDLLWPGYYLTEHLAQGCPLFSLVSIFTTLGEFIKQHNLREKSKDEDDPYFGLDSNLMVLTPNRFGENYSESNLNLKNLPPLSNPMFEDDRYRMFELDKPGVCLFGNNESLRVGYLLENAANYVCFASVPYLIPKRGIDVRYIAAVIQLPEVKQQIISICDGNVTSHTLSMVLDRVIVPKHTPKERAEFLAEANYQALLAAKQELKKNHEDYKKAVRMRKHALTQSLSSIEAMFYTLNAYRMRQDGKLQDSDVISRRKGSTVKEAFEFIEHSLKNMMVKLDHIADVEYSFGNVEAIDPENFIEEYIAKHENGWLNFKPVISWEKGHNLVKYDVVDPATGKIILPKGSPAHMLHFAKVALEHVFNNIISNAMSHGFTDENRKDYQLRFSWHSDGLGMIVEIENNGTAIPQDRDTSSLLEYGVSTALHENGHNGIGCNEIDDIMRRYGGKVEIVSTPDEEFTVKYKLTFRS